MINKKKLISLLKNKQLKKVAILGHTSVDPDSIASAFGMSYLLNKLNSKIKVDVLIDGISKATNELIEYYNHSFLIEPEPPYDLIIIVDVNVLSQLGLFQKLIIEQIENEIIIIDHHSPSDFSNKIKNSYIQEDKSSTAEIVMDLLIEINIKLEKPLLTILLAGIIYDSRRFYTLNLELIKLLEKMIIQGADYDLAINLLQKKLDISERIARLKSASRLKCYRTKNWLITWSKIGSHEGASARGIIDLGADVAFVYSKRKKSTRLSVRATYEFFRNTGINFANVIMNPISQKYQGDGGGHSIAAALSIPKSIEEEEILSQIIKILEDKLSEKLTKVKS